MEVNKTDNSRHRAGGGATGALTGVCCGHAESVTTRVSTNPNAHEPAGPLPGTSPRDGSTRVHRDLRDHAQSGFTHTGGRPRAHQRGKEEQTVAPSCRVTGLGDQKGQATNAFDVNTPEKRPVNGKTRCDDSETGRMASRRHASEGGLPSGGLHNARPGSSTAGFSRVTALFSTFPGTRSCLCQN